MNLLFLLLILTIVSIVSYFISKSGKRKKGKLLQNEKKRLDALPLFSLNLENIKVNGIHWQEENAVDVYNNELKKDNIFLTLIRNKYSLKNKLHKYKTTDKFSSTIIIPVTYKNKKDSITFKIPMEHTIIRMELMIKKETSVYFEKNDSSQYRYIFDFNFLENQEINFLYAPFLPEN